MTETSSTTLELPDITPANVGLDGVAWNVMGQVYVPKQVSEESIAWHATFPIETFVPPHTHPFQDEYIFVIDGRIDLLRMPRGLPHAFFNNSGEAVTALFWAAPAGKLLELYQRLHNVTNPAEATRIARDYDVIFAPPVSSAATTRAEQKPAA